MNFSDSDESDDSSENETGTMTQRGGVMIDPDMDSGSESGSYDDEYEMSDDEEDPRATDDFELEEDVEGGKGTTLGERKKSNMAVLKLKLKARRARKRLKEKKKERMNIFLRTDFKEELKMQNKTDGNDGGDITESEDELDEDGNIIVPGWKKTRMKFIRRVRIIFFSLQLQFFSNTLKKFKIIEKKKDTISNLLNKAVIILPDTHIHHRSLYPRINLVGRSPPGNGNILFNPVNSIRKFLDFHPLLVRIN